MNGAALIPCPFCRQMQTIVALKSKEDGTFGCELCQYIWPDLQSLSEDVKIAEDKIDVLKEG